MRSRIGTPQPRAPMAQRPSAPPPFSENAYQRDLTRQKPSAWACSGWSISARLTRITRTSSSGMRQRNAGGLDTGVGRHGPPAVWPGGINARATERQASQRQLRARTLTRLRTRARNSPCEAAKHCFLLFDVLSIDQHTPGTAGFGVALQHHRAERRLNTAALGGCRVVPEARRLETRAGFRGSSAIPHFCSVKPAGRRATRPLTPVVVRSSVQHQTRDLTCDRRRYSCCLTPFRRQPRCNPDAGGLHRAWRHQRFGNCRDAALAPVA